MRCWIIIGLTLITIVAVFEAKINDTCMDLKFVQVHDQFEQAFQYVAETPIYNNVQVLKYPLVER